MTVRVNLSHRSTPGGKRDLGTFAGQFTAAVAPLGTATLRVQ